MTNNILKFWQSLDSDDPLDPLFQAAPVLMHAIDRNGAFCKVSEFWAAKLGYQVSEMLGRSSLDFLSDESKIYAQTIAQPEVFETGKAYNVEYDFVRKDGSLLPVLLSAISEYDKAGNHVRSLAIIFDNSEAKRAAEELRRKQRMEAIGALAGGVAHDFNNLLSVVQGNLEFLKEDPDSADRLELIENAISATYKGAQLTQQLLSYGRKARLSPSEISINTAVRSTDRMIRRLLPATIALETVTDAGLWNASIDSSLLETAIINIVNNARDAMCNGGKITIETANVRISGDYVEKRHEEITPGRYVMLAITDTGHGMTEDVLSKVFDPFYTTKSVGQGSGLGLSMVFGFVRQSEGTIRGYSEEGVGSTFKLYFPASQTTEPLSVESEYKELNTSGAGKLVLLAEDEANVREVLIRQLKAKKFSVEACVSGDEAMLRVQEGLLPDVLLTDIVMPGSLQGPELAKSIRKIIPELKVLFVSGYPNEAAIHGNGVQPCDSLLVKPFSQKDLLHSLFKLLE